MTWSVGPYALRQHQQVAVEALRRSLSRRRRAHPPRVILQGVCGFGKTIVSSYITKAATDKGKRVLFIARGRVLIFQKSDTLCECELPHSVVMADARKYIDPAYAVQKTDGDYGGQIFVVSKDTYASGLKAGRLPKLDVDLAIVDECHTAMTKGWQDLLTEMGCPMIGLSATPALGTGVGLGEVWDDIVVGARHQDLIDTGSLVPCRWFSPFAADIRGLRVDANSGEFNQAEMTKRFHKKSLIGDFLTEWHRLAEGRQTAFYASSVDHSIAQTEAFREGDGTLLCPGVPWEHVDADTPQSERRRIYKALASGDIQGVSNYAVLRVGFDCPAISCLQLGVSMNSLVEYLQTCGRGFRPFPGKENCLILDHGGNLERHEWPQFDRPWSLDAKKNGVSDYQPAEQDSTVVCRKCGAARPRAIKKCPYCNHEVVRTGTLMKTKKGTLEEVRPPEPREKSKAADIQKAWDGMYFPSKNSKSRRANSFNQLVARFHREYPQYTIERWGKLTTGVDKTTGQRVTLGNIPRPNSKDWKLPANFVFREDLQYPYRGETNGEG